MIIIGIQGDIGSFSEQAAHVFAKKRQLSNYQISPLINSGNVLKAVDVGEIDFGILAIENARGGLVTESIYALATYQCHIDEMFQILIQQNLLTLPGLTAREITSIHSHTQAIRQCKEYLMKHFWNCPLIEEADTAQAAKALQTGQLPKTAAVIANVACATHYKLAILEENIQDLKNNFTQFLSVTRFRKKR